MIAFTVIGVFVGLSVLATLLVFASVILSSRISHAEASPDPIPAHSDRPEPEPLRDLKRDPLRTPPSL